MSLLALNSALTGLKVNQRALSVVSDNIANANTEGYTRKIVRFENLNLGGQKSGVRVSEIQRQVDEFLLRDRRAEKGNHARFDVLADYYSGVQNVFGRPADNNTVSNKIADFGTSFQSLAATPTDGFRRTKVNSEAERLIADFNKQYNALQDLRQKTDEEIGIIVSRVNEILEGIEDYNHQIARSETLGDVPGSSGDLRDMRDKLVDELSTYMDVTSFVRPNGDMVVSTIGGQVLVDVDAVQLRHDVAQGVTPNVRYNSAQPNGGVGRFQGILIEGRDPANPIDLTDNIFQGELKGLIEMRDEVLPDMQEQVDSLAEMIRDQVNKAHNDGSGFPPRSTLTGTRVFDLNQTIDVDSITTQIYATDANGDVLERMDLAAVFAAPPAIAGDQTIQAVINKINGTAGTRINARFEYNDPALVYPAAGEGRLVIEAANGAAGIVISEDPANPSNIGLHNSRHFTRRDEALNLPAGSFTINAGTLPGTTVTIDHTTTLDSIAADINADPDLQAQVVADGRGFRINITTLNSATSPVAITGDSELTDILGISDQSGGFSFAFGLNDYFVNNGEHSATAGLGIREDLVTDPNGISTSRPGRDLMPGGTPPPALVNGMASSAVAGQSAVSAGDNTNAQALANVFDTRVAFTRNGSLGPISATLAEYGARVVGKASVDGTTINNERDLKKAAVENLDKHWDNVSAVNVDEEMAYLIQFQNAYSASARVVQVSKEVLDELLSIAR